MHKLLKNVIPNELVSDYRKMKNPRRNSIPKQAKHKEEMMSGFGPQQFGGKSIRSPNPDFSKHPSYLDKENRISRSRLQNLARENNNKNHQFRNYPIAYHHAISTNPNYFDLEEEMLLNPQFRKNYMKRLRNKGNMLQSKATIRKTKSQQITKLKSNCGGKKTTYKNSSIVCNHLASSVEGLIVILNPNEQEYKTDAVKNNFIGFKYHVHSPYDFPYVDAIGRAMGPNIQSNIGFLGFHSWITDAADAYKPGEKKCASKHDIALDVFQDYTQQNCVFECQTKSMFKNCQ